ncbi:TPA: IS4 family transposase [Legionella pneumophila]|uniref:IS4 family transposase n=1 Tax=Legionella pneumophila TaxID=446 RepID=UPI001C1C3BFA|nr:IS4 family transposase [Legionella pneumophila]
MHLIELLHKTFEEKLPQIHKSRLNSLLTACDAAIISNKLYLTGLGRSLSNTNKECSNIQKVDRLLGNGHLQSERGFFYKLMTSHVIQEYTCPWIHIDWTCINPVTNLYGLRASVSMKGRSLVIYETCYPKKQENNHATHKDFLNQLKALLPVSVKPIIVTDAGFRGLWFNYILKLGWDFVGRLRNKNAVCMGDTSTWCLSSSYFQLATSKPTYIGHGLLTEKGKVPAHFVVYKGAPKGRKTLTLNTKKQRACKKNKVHSKGHKEPWVLITSLKKASLSPSLIVNIYRQRMRIEENIRDTKCPHYGLGLKDSLTQSPQRMNILLLIGAIATFAAWLAGLFVKSIGKAADFQAQSAKFTSALSYVFLGRRALKKGLDIRKEEFKNTLLMLYHRALQAQQENPHYG